MYIIMALLNIKMSVRKLLPDLSNPTQKYGISLHLLNLLPTAEAGLQDLTSTPTMQPPSLCPATLPPRLSLKHATHAGALQGEHSY